MYETKGEDRCLYGSHHQTAQSSHHPGACRESVKTQLELYAEFIDASPSYVITEALKLLFRRDDDFRCWADQHANNHNNGKAKGDVLAKAV